MAMRAISTMRLNSQNVLAGFGRSASCTKSVPTHQPLQRRSATSTWVFLCANQLKELKFQSRIGGLDHVRDVGVAGSNPVTPTKEINNLTSVFRPLN
jgi:hypothetical protein